MDKTTRRDCIAKKWIIVLGLIVSVGIALLCYMGIFILSEPVLDDYLTNVSSYPKSVLHAYSVYDNTSADYSNSVFFIGSSIVGAGFRSDKIRSSMNNSSEDIGLYNLQISMDTPLMRSLEMQKIIDAKPKMVIFGLTYRDLIDNLWKNERITLSRNNMKLRDDALYLYSNSELSDINSPPRLDYKKSYLLSAWKHALTNKKTSTSTPNSAQTSTTEAIMSVDELRKEANTSRMLVWHSELPAEHTRYKEALLYNVKTLDDVGIEVVIINMPIHPTLSDLISDTTRQNYFDVLNKTGTQWYNMEKLYSHGYFTDASHLSNKGTDAFSPLIADIISKGGI